MLPIELLLSVLSGVSGGLLGVLWGVAVSAPWIARRSAGGLQSLHLDTTARLAAAAFLSACGGAALGFLYWLGWGLISLVQPAWYVAGALFGLLTWAGVALPVLGGLAVRVRGFGRLAPVLAIEWLVTCVAVGLLCARTWHDHA